MVASYLYQHLQRVHPMLSIEATPLRRLQTARTVGIQNVPVYSIEDPTIIETILRMRDKSIPIESNTCTCRFQG